MNPVDGHITEDDVVREIGYVPMKDGTRIACISYRPEGGSYPAVFWYSPYTASAGHFEFAKPYLEAGYAFVGANFPATGCSEGVIEHWFDRKEGFYGAEVVEWIARQPWSDGNVGMIGNSSAGTVQFWVAAERPPHLRAIVASGVADAYEGFVYVGGMFQLGAATWALSSEFVTQVAGVEWRIDAGDNQCAAIREGKQVVKRPFFDEVRKRPLKDEWWDSVSLACEEVAGRVDVPTMLIASWQDEYCVAVRDSTRIFAHLLPNVTQKRLLLMNGDHRVSMSANARSYSFVDAERMKFLDRWVKGVENAAEEEPPVTVYWDVQDDGGTADAVAGWTTSHDTWPEPTVERRPYYLTADAALSPDEPGGHPAEGERAYLYPAGAELVGSDQQFAVQPYPEGVLHYRTAAASSDMALLGNPEVTLYLSIDHGDDTDLELTLKDVDGDGNILYLQGGLLRASLRTVDEALTSADEVVHSFRKRDPLVPDEVYEIRMSLLNPIAHVVRYGHHLELTIGAPNPIPHPVYGSIAAGGPSINRVYHSKRHPSRIVLPLLPGAAAGAPVPELRMLRGQACRKHPDFVPGGLTIP